MNPSLKDLESWLDSNYNFEQTELIQFKVEMKPSLVWGRAKAVRTAKDEAGSG